MSCGCSRQKPLLHMRLEVVWPIFDDDLCPEMLRRAIQSWQCSHHCPKLQYSLTWDRQQRVACCDMDPSPSRNSDIRNLKQMRWSFEPTVACPISAGGSGNGRCASTSGHLELRASDLHTGSFAVHRARGRTGAPRKGENLHAEALATGIGRPWAPAQVKLSTCRSLNILRRSCFTETS